MPTIEDNQKKQTLSTHHRIRWIFNIVVLIVLPLFCVIGLALNLSRGYFLKPNLDLDRPVNFEVFKNEKSDISIVYPRGWSVFEFSQGNDEDTEVLALLCSGSCLRSPFIEIATTTISKPSLEKVAQWGQSRIDVDEYQIISFKKIEIEQKETFQMEYRYIIPSPIPKVLNSEKWQCYHIYLLDDIKAYTVEMCSLEENFSKMESVFNKVIQNIRIDSE